MAGGKVSTAVARDRREPRHQGEAFEVIIPKLALAAEAAQLDHRQGKIKIIVLGLLNHLPIEVEAGHILR
jgi:hypothetical protein